MTNGAVILALNNHEIDYIKLAVYAAKRVNKFLDIPVTLITDNKKWCDKYYPDYKFDKIIEIKSDPYVKRNINDGAMSSKLIDWKNTNRHKVYDLTPYDKTLVLDADYIINSSTLKTAFKIDHDFQIYKNSYDISGWRSSYEFVRINPYSVPFYWATCFVFEKNVFTQSFFHLVEYIKSNWEYFKILYNINSKHHLFRNDHAFSIAINIMNGKTEGEFAVNLPGKMYYCRDTDVLIGIDDTKMSFLLQKEKYLGEYFLSQTSNLDIHVMNKMSLSRVLDGASNV